MVTSEETLRKIKEIIERNYRQLTISVLGASVFTPQELKELKAAGVDINNQESFLELIYNHNFINNPVKPESPTSVPDMLAQQAAANAVPVGEAHSYTIASQNNKTKEYLERLALDVSTRVQGIIRDNNDAYKMDALQNLERSEIADRMVKESSLGKVRQQLRDTSKNANRDWQRVAITEMSNMVGIGSVDRIVSNNQDTKLDEVYVYRIPVNDALTCKWCRKFYGDAGETPKIYRLSTLLANGSNYGIKSDQWKPVVGATHPNTRTSQVIEVRPGWKVLPGGALTYIGLEEWRSWLFENLVA